MSLMQRTPQAGMVLHMGVRECCMTDEFYQDAAHGKTMVQRILSNAVAAFLSHTDLLAGAPAPGPVVFPMTLPWKTALPLVPRGPCAPPPPREAEAVPEPEE